MIVHKVQSVLNDMFVMSSKVEEPDTGYYFFSTCLAELTALTLNMISSTYGYPIPATQTAILATLSASLSQTVQKSEAFNKISWNSFIEVCAMWVATPFITMFLSCTTYWIIKKSILEKNTQIRSFIVTPYISGIVFMIYCSFAFTTEYYTKIESNNLKMSLIPIILFIGFYFGMIFKRMHFFLTKFTPAMSFFEAFRKSLLVW